MLCPEQTISRLDLTNVLGIRSSQSCMFNSLASHPPFSDLPWDVLPAWACFHDVRLHPRVPRPPKVWANPPTRSLTSRSLE